MLQDRAPWQDKSTQLTPKRRTAQWRNVTGMPVIPREVSDINVTDCVLYFLLTVDKYGTRRAPEAIIFSKVSVAFINI